DVGSLAQSVEGLGECVLDDVLAFDDGAGESRAVSMKLWSDGRDHVEELLARLPDRQRSLCVAHARNVSGRSVVCAVCTDRSRARVRRLDLAALGDVGGECLERGEGSERVLSVGCGDRRDVLEAGTVFELERL